MREDARLVAALDRRRVGGWQLTAQAADADDAAAAGGWWHFAGGIAVAPLVVDGAPVAAAAMQDAPAAAALLTPVEPLLAALETVLATPLEPVGLRQAPDDDGRAIRIEAVGADGVTMLRVVVALPADLAVPHDAVDALPLAPEALAAVPVAWRGSIGGPAVAASRQATIAPGDLLLLGTGPLRATLDRGYVALLDLTQGTLIVQDDAPQPVEDAPDRLRFTFAGGTAPAGRLATLTVGGTLPLPLTGATLPVSVSSGGVALGAGELVAIGEGYGVIVTERHGER